MKKILSFAKPFWPMIALALVMIFAQSMADLYLPNLMSDIINVGVIQGKTGQILSIGGLMLLISAFGVLCSILASYLSARIALGMGRDLRSAIFRKVSSFSLEEYDRFGASTLVTRSTNDVMQVQNVVVMMLRMMIGAPLMMIGGIIMASREDAGLTWVLAIAIPVLLLIIAILAAEGLPLFQAMQGKIDRINLVLREKLTGIRVIRAFNRESRERERFEEANKDLTDNYIRVNYIMAILMPAIMLVMSLTQLAILWFGIVRIDSGDMQIGSLMAFTQYAVQILFSLMMVSMVFIMVPRAASAARRIAEVLAVEPGIVDPTDPLPLLDNEHGRVEFRQVSFRYAGAEQKALDGISFVAEPGKITAIIGSTGSGKSTLLNLVPRLYDPSEGQVLVSGTDVRFLRQADLRNALGLIPQKSLLFAGSISDNIRHGKADASQADIEEAARIAQAEEFISGMEAGYQHQISQGGSNLSGGQKQRLAIARALVRRPPIYLFDDSFSALDFTTDKKLRQALSLACKDATVIMVAQRVGTIREADQILVLDEGRIVGRGTHHELMSSCPTYQEIVGSQLSEEESV